MEQRETERAWSEALAREHAHQRELLAAFRGELREFARECAAALDSLDSFVDGLGGVVNAIELARDTHGPATLVLDVARRFPALSTVQQDDLYVALGEDGDLPPRVVEEARALLAQPGRSDGELLKAIVDSSSTPAIARMSLASGVGALGTPSPPHRIARPRSRSRLLVAGLAVLAALIGAAAALVATRGGTEAIAEAPVQPPTVAAIEAVFREADKATYYSVAVSPDEKVQYAWSLRPPAGDPGCTKLSQVPGKPNEAIWRHGGTDGCRHVTTEHLGTVTVTITTPISTCTARFVGSETRTSPDEPRCRPR